jgi:hypothetical protein
MMMKRPASCVLTQQLKNEPVVKIEQSNDHCEEDAGTDVSHDSSWDMYAEGDDDTEYDTQDYVNHGTDKGANSITNEELNITDASNRNEMRQQAKELAIKIGMPENGSLQERVAAYCRAMITQDVGVLKQVYLPGIFRPEEMSSLWQMLKGWIAKASPAVQKKWKELKEKPGRGGDKQKTKLEILNLALVRKKDWQDIVAKSTTEVSKETSVWKEGRWMYRGEIENTIGMAQAQRFLEKGKWEKGEESDGDSIYRKVVKGDSEVRKRTDKASIEKSMRGNQDDMDALENCLAEWFTKETATSKQKTAPKRQTSFDAAQRASKRLKASGQQQASGSGQEALTDFEPPADPNSTAPQTAAKQKATSMIKKLAEKKQLL